MWRDKNSGYSLVEMLVVVGLAGVVTLITTTFLRNQAQIAMESKARDQSRDMNRDLLNIIERDMTFRFAPNTFSIDPTQLSLTIDRRQALNLNLLSAFNNRYQVRYQTRCVNRPIALNSYQTLTAQLASPRLTNQGRCLRLIRCGGNQVPHVFVDTFGSGRIPPYGIREYPRPSSDLKTVRSRPMGSAACFTSNGNQVRIIVDTISSQGADLFRVTSADRSLEVGASNLLLLPHE